MPFLNPLKHGLLDWLLNPFVLEIIDFHGWNIKLIGLKKQIKVEVNTSFQ